MKSTCKALPQPGPQFGLLNGRLSPITYEIGFLEAERDTVLRAYLNWMRPIYAPRGIQLTSRPVRGNLEQVLRTLLPLTSVLERRYLFVPTRSPWTAYFDNGHQGTDAFPPMSYLARTIRCRGMRVTYVPENFIEPYPSRTLEIYGPDATDFLNFIRSVGLVDDDGWTFCATGTVQPYEEPDAYTAKRVKDRFPVALFQRYLRDMGVIAFDQGFYLADEAVLVEKVGDTHPRSKEFGLPFDADGGG